MSYLRKIIRKFKKPQKVESDFYNINGMENKVIIIRNGVENEIKKYYKIPGLNIQITGNNNIIKLEMPIDVRNSNIIIEGCDNCEVFIGSTTYCINALTIHFGNSNNQRIIIGKRNSIVGAFIGSNEENSEIIIGNDCMFASRVYIVGSDGHAILDKTTGNIINRQKCPLVVGDKVWIGECARLMKNAQISNGSIVGAFALVTKPFKKENIILAGNPAKIVRENVIWDRKQISQIEKETQNSNTI